MTATNSTWRKTHRITFIPAHGPEQRWDVMATLEGPCYTADEWLDEQSADWELTEAGEFRFLGREAPGNGRVIVTRM